MPAYQPGRRRRRDVQNAVLIGTVAGILAGIFLSLTNVAIDYIRRPRLVFVARVEASNAFDVLLVVRNLP